MSNKYVYCPRCHQAVPESDIVEVQQDVQGWKRLLLGTPFDVFVLKTDKMCKNCLKRGSNGKNN
jgi:hypothetical protein